MKHALLLVIIPSLLSLGSRPAVAQPANNNFANAYVVSGTTVATNGNSNNANRESGEPWILGDSLQAGGRSVWFAWTAPVSALTQINTTNSSFNTLLGVYTGTAVSALSLVASNDNVTGQNYTSAVQFQAVQGTTYRIVIDGRSNFGTNPRSGNYNLNIRVLAAVAISSPANNTVFATGTSIPITVASTLPNPLTRVDLYRAGILIATDTTDPFAFTYTPSAPGTNTFFVVGTDTTSLLWTSAPVNLIVRDPGVILTAPADGATYWNTNPIPFSATALAASGNITAVSFYAHTNLIATDTTSPYTATWATVTPGLHRLTALAADNQGRAYTSAPVLISVALPLIATGSVWKYLDTGADPDPAWTTLEYDDTAWPSGPAQLGYGDGDEATLVSFGPDEANKHITTWFRHTFPIPHAAAYSNLHLSLLRDDGAVVYLNGVEIFRSNMPEGPINSTTLASGAASDDGTTYFTNLLTAALLRDGPNLLAVEVHQSGPTSSDLSFDFALQGLLTITRNQPPLLVLTSPTNAAHYLAPAQIPLAATATDPDGAITTVEYFAADTSLGALTAPPYETTWSAPPLGWHEIRAVATDNENATTTASATLAVYDAAGTPLLQWDSPPSGATYEAPAQLTLRATASAAYGLRHLIFLNQGLELGRLTPAQPLAIAPHTYTWTNPPIGTATLAAVAVDTRGLSSTSALATLTLTPAPTNAAAPTIAAVTPPRGAVLTLLTNLAITFSEPVTGVDASDLLLNGVAATRVTGSGSNFTFTVTQPPYGLVTLTWATNHGIRDLGPGAPLPFDPAAPGATWTYTLNDGVPPTLVARTPAPGSTLANLTLLGVSFSEPVTGVHASDLLINNLPAISLSGSGANYTFAFPSPGPGNVVISWTAQHGITDLTGTPFDATAPGATWTYTLTGQRVTLVASNATYRWLPGTNEASAPLGAWRAIAFHDTAWPAAPAPFYYDDDGSPVPYTGHTLLSGMRSNYPCIFARHAFVMTNRLLFTKLQLRHRFDDGALIWLNGVEIARVRLPVGDLPYTATAENVPEPIVTNSIVLPDPSPLVDGVNLLAVQAFNAALDSSDFLMELDLTAEYLNPATAAPRIATVQPPAGPLLALTNLTVTFTRPVTNLDAADLLIAGQPAAAVNAATGTVFTFTFAQPPYGAVAVTWAADHAIAGLDTALAFDATAPGATWQYTLRNPDAPVIAGQTPPADATLTTLTTLTVAFNKNVTGVDAADLLLSGLPATHVTGGGASYTFAFPQPPYGQVTVAWAAGHGIRDAADPANVFDATREGSFWSYTLNDLVPPTLSAVDPPPGAAVTNLTAVTVTFSEPVTGVDARDLLVNGGAATGLAGGGAVWTFTFPTPNATSIQFTWAANHGITDLASVPNPFVPTGADTWFYLTPDTVPPAVASLSPPPASTVRSLRTVVVYFTEPVVGVTASALLVNGGPAQGVTGSDAGPYTFTFPQPANGPVEVRWGLSHTITDIALEPNRFVGGSWDYLLDPNASFANKVVINEIMYSPLGSRESDQWLELHNVSGEAINLANWRFTRGIQFTFPAVSLPAGGYLVVAANLAAFQADYPGVTNAVGGWAGRLSNNGETLELVTAQGEVVNTVRYASEGDWARRERGHGASLVTRITRNGSTATVNLFGHDYTSTDLVMISGADQPEYNGVFAISSLTSDTFRITVPGEPASPATGRIICRQVRDNGASGWSWFSPADGYGSSLELVNPALPNNHGQCWQASVPAGGTPGQANSMLATNVAPLILDVTHFPPVPKSTDTVAITARVQDELAPGVQSVRLFYRNHSVNYGNNPPPFDSLPMLDNGTQGDGVAGDGLYGALLPPLANGQVMEFYVQATDTTGLIRTWPAPAWETNNTLAQLANALYQVDDAATTSDMPFLRLVMTETERAQLAGIDTASDAEMNATFISHDGDGAKVRYLCGMRLRGAGSRGGLPKNYRVNIPNDNRWNGVEAINLNSRYPHAQLAGSVLAQKAGLAAADARVVQLRVNGQNLATAGSVNYGAYLLVEPMNGAWAENHFPLDPEGNVYRGSKYPWNANLDYLGTNAAVYQGQTGAGYYKASNTRENDWTDLFQLTYALSTNTPDADYVAAVTNIANVEECLRYFAVCNFFDYMETSLCRGVGDDYAMYRGKVDRRFRFVAHDFDTILGQGDTAGSTTRSIWVMIDNPASTDPTMQATFLRRFMRHPEFAPIYFRLYKQNLDTVFAPENLNPLLDQMLGSWVTGNAVPAMKTFAANRRTYLLSQIPLVLTATTTLNTQSGYLRAANPNVTLTGQANVIETRRVLVNGTPSVWSAWEGRWTNTVTLQPGINQVLVQSVDANNVEFARTNLVIWYDRGAVQNVSGTIATDTVWPAANGPYSVTANLTVASGATLTIQPGTTLYLGSGVNLTVANGGRLLAEGTETAPIRFTRAPGTSTTWGGITVNGGPNSPETRIVYAHIEFNNSTAIQSTDGTVFLANLTFGNTARQYVSLDRSSFVVQDCTFPATTGSFEPTHGSGGIKAGGRGIFLRNYFGAISGYNDTLDFTGGNRPGPILQVIGNVFMGTGDDHLDLDSTDAWVEGNIFLHTHQNGSPDSASGVSGGSDNADTSQVTILRNIFYNCDQAAMIKQGGFYTLYHNTIVRQTRQGGTDTDSGVICLADAGTAPGAGMYLEGNIIYDAEKLVRNPSNAVVTLTNNLMPFNWSGPGGGNSAADPLFKYIPAVTETSNFTSWAQAQVMWDWFSLRPGSPARGTGPNGQDLGAGLKSEISNLKFQRGVSISGEPLSPTPQTAATLTVGLNRTGSGIPTAGWPSGSGYTQYRWRLDGGEWSAESPLTAPIPLSGLGQGVHQVEVVGRNDAGWWQDDPVLGPDARVSGSRSWTVRAGASVVRLSEVLASNARAVPVGAKYPDLIELLNESTEPVELSGMRLTDDPREPDKFIFPYEASIPGRGYLVLLANEPDGTPGYHLGFNLSAGGEGVYLYDAAENGGALLDSVVFGPQVTDFSIGRGADGAWALCVPTFGGPNQAAPVGEARGLRINEWLAIAQPPFAADFVELYNPQGLPVPLGGLYLSDEILGWQDRHQIAALSFIPAYGFARFIADGNSDQGAEHLSFQLSGDQGAIGLYQPDLTLIDLVLYQAQRANGAQGRTPNGSSTIAFLSEPTPGAGNPLVTSRPPPLVMPLVAMTNGWRFDQSGADLGTAWREPGYNDAGWPSGAALLGVEDAVLPFPLLTPLSLSSGGAPVITYYFRSTFVAPTNGAISALALSHVLDDGAVIYLNGQEVLRFNMPGGAVSASTLTPSSTGDATLVGPVELPADALWPGTNVLAVEVHQSSVGSSDVVFGLALEALVVTNTAASGAVVINEVLALNNTLAEADGSTPDWVELMNLSAGRVALGGLGLTDDSLQPQRWVFPAGVEIAPGGFLRVFFDGDRPASATNTGFGLKATGGSVYLFDSPTNGGSLLSSVTYGIQLGDFTIGREPDGSTNWVLCAPTPRAPNVPVGSLGNAMYLRVNEWMADPGPGADDWFELYNPEPQPVALGGLYLTDNLNNRVKHRIAPLSFIGAGREAWLKFIADNNTAAGADHVNFALSANGEAVGLASATGTPIDAYAFGPQAQGVSQGRFPDGGSNVVTFPGTASPGAANYRWLTNVVINEVLTRTSEPLEDAIELRNLSGQDVDLSGWWLSDDMGTLQKYRIPFGTILPANGFTVFYEHAFTNRELAEIPFALSSAGDEVVLSAAAGGWLTGWRTHVKFAAADSGVSFGRYVTSDNREEFVALTARTFGVDDPGSVEQFRTGTGAPNAYPRVGPVVFTEIMYHPPDLGTNDNVRDEFVELQNITTAPVDLFVGTNGWRLRAGVDFDFRPGTTIAPGDYLLVVSFDPVNNPVTLAGFRARYNLDPSVAIVGPYSGKLDNGGEAIELRQPGPVTADGASWVLVERISYLDRYPWDADADGTGWSLQRVAPAEFGNDPANWVAAAPTPGPQALPLDRDGDGMLDAWELANGLDASDPTDAGQDADGDGLTNLEEFLAGTDPRDPTSVLRIEPVAPVVDGTNLVFQFLAKPNVSYTVEYSDTLGTATWFRLLDVDAAQTNRVIEVITPVNSAGRFFRLRTPMRP